MFLDSGKVNAQFFICVQLFERKLPNRFCSEYSQLDTFSQMNNTVILVQVLLREI